jgi:uncharacterized membrane protein YsdA (DUF1294 family)
MTYLILVNAAGFLLMLLDKQFAIHHRWRIPEATLLAVAAIGGSVGSWLGMQLFRHKTKKPLFTIGIPLIFAAQLAIWHFFPGLIKLPQI